MNRLVCAFLTAVLLCASGVTACARSSEGTARTATQEASTSTTSTATGTTGTAVTSETSAARDAPESSQPGVLETTRIPRPPNAIVCPSPRHGPTAVAAVADPAAPRITVSLPDGWSSATGSGDVGAALSGPNAMVAQVSITPTSLDAAAAFSRYSDDVMARYPISTLSMLPAELCGFSSQEMMGTWADNPDRSITYRDRIAHIWTNAKDYLVAIHVQAPSGTPGFDAAADQITGDFGIGLP
ncbi:MAG: LpqN/LpqT family lipoprotein [Mycolicibacterium sp.]|nr:LpqN/LpqT family lipoprotein [Mycobacterium sp.]MCB9416523.1 LpqN/LpqT family lipoprotein [Mycolicibacterium sp.]TXI51999.1 MAG: hypothetical protein E6Q57_05600 [Mycobacterium sp.]